jgi:hypothetical protein
MIAAAVTAAGPRAATWSRDTAAARSRDSSATAAATTAAPSASENLTWQTHAHEKKCDSEHRDTFHCNTSIAVNSSVVL